MNKTTAPAAQPTCENPWDGGCQTPATREGLLQVANPSAEHPEGVQRKVKVCEPHSYTWSALWGTWPLEPAPEADPEPEVTEDDEEPGLTVKLTGWTAKLVERVAREEGVTKEQALLLVLDQAAQLVDAGLLLGEEEAATFLPHLDETAVTLA